MNERNKSGVKRSGLNEGSRACSVRLTREEMTEGLLEPDGLLVELAWTLVGVLGEAAAQLLHLRLALGPQEDDDRCVLGVVQAIDGVRRDVKNAVLPL